MTKFVDLIEPAAASCMKMELSEDVHPENFHFAAMLSTAISLRRIANALEKPEATGQIWSDMPLPQGLGEHLRARCDEAEKLQAELDVRFEPETAIDPNSDQMRGIEMARALEMMHQSGR